MPDQHTVTSFVKINQLRQTRTQQQSLAHSREAVFSNYLERHKEIVDFQLKPHDNSSSGKDMVEIETGLLDVISEYYSFMVLLFITFIILKAEGPKLDMCTC